MAVAEQEAASYTAIEAQHMAKRAGDPILFRRMHQPFPSTDGGGRSGA